MQQNLWLPRESDRVIDNKLKCHAVSRTVGKKVLNLHWFKKKNAVLDQRHRSCTDKLVQSVELISHLSRCWGADTYCMSPTDMMQLE